MGDGPSAARCRELRLLPHSISGRFHKSILIIRSTPSEATARRAHRKGLFAARPKVQGGRCTIWDLKFRHIVFSLAALLHRRRRERPFPAARALPSMAVLARFAEALGRCGVRPGDHVAVALSGGPDSLALAALTAQWWRQQPAAERNEVGYVCW